MNYSDIHENILKWYDRYGRRDLPWRQTTDPYAIYISEMMLQQTQVQRVLEHFYHPFLKRFPTLQSIKNAPIDDLLHAWQGLGYYRRAHYIHRTAQIAAPDLPTEPMELMKLPGIGRSTAHAVAAFAYHRPVAVLDANIKRVLCRFFALTEPKEPLLWKMAEMVLDKEAPYIYNQAMMDIGATICLSKTPKCESCPLSSGCLGREEPLLYATKKGAQKRKIVQRRIGILSDGEALFLRKRKGRLLGGLWEFPDLEELGSVRTESVCTITHTYSHFTLVAEIHKIEETDPLHLTSEGRWIDRKELGRLPTSSLEKKIVKALFETDAN